MKGFSAVLVRCGLRGDGYICCCHQPITDIIMKTQYKMFGQLIYLIFYLIFSTQNWLEIEILELQKEIVERTKLTNIFLFFCI